MSDNWTERIKRSLKAHNWAGYRGKAIDDLTEEDLIWLIIGLIEDYDAHMRLRKLVSELADEL